ncbi:MAG TPA: TonB family protein, partial [Longimicrobium sp.]|nr:TonB family protein [Longimicrobium sp.]
PPEYTPRQAVQRLYPQIAQGTGDSATVVLYFDAGGKLVDHRMTVRGQRSGQPPPAAMHQGGSLERHHFAAGELGPDPVTVFTLRQPTPGERAAAVAGRVDTVVVPALATTVRGEAVLSPAATIAGTAEAVPVPAAAATRGAEAVLAPATTVGGAAEAVPAPATATTIRGTARAVAAPVTATTRGVEAVVVPATTARGTEAVIVPATATTRPVEATIVPGTATVRPTGAAVTPGAATVSPRDTVPVSVANPEELTRALRREYPAQFRAAGIFGTAVLELHVAADGTLSRTRVVESSHPAFGEAAVRAIAAARFRPARHRGVAVASTARIPLMFRLSRESAPVSARAGGAEGARLAPAGVRVGGAEPGYDRPPEPASAHDLARALGAAYPPLLRQAGVAADAHVLVRVSASGEVLSAQVVAASHPEAGAAAARVLSGTRFRPARKDGRPVAAEVEVPVEFRLDTRERP